MHLALRTLAGLTGRGAAEEVDVRRVVAGFLEGSGDVRVDRAGSTRKAATAPTATRAPIIAEYALPLTTGLPALAGFKI